ncbi:MAG: four helix bundle protein [Deltaproteobacteria bacterium]|nr:four helix bundle protein [Deltaproteobacteria bacterium]
MPTIIRSFRDLAVWKLGKEIVLDIYRVTAEFPKRETFGLVSQMRRSAVSVPSNIAEGFNRQHTGEFRRFLSIALGSCGELDTQVDLSCELSLMEAIYGGKLFEKLDHEGKMLRRLIQQLR